MKDEALIKIIGGANVNGAWISAFSRLLNTLLEIGRAVGSSISRYLSGTKC